MDKGVNMLTNLFGDIALDTSIKSLIQRLSKFKFSSTSDLYVNVTALPTLGSVTTVTTVTTGNIGFGDQGKVAAAIQTSAQNFHSTVGRNFTRN